MPELKTGKTQYGDDFRFRSHCQNMKRTILRPTSPTRMNKPHPVTDFLIYNRLPLSKDELKASVVRRHVLGARGACSAREPRVSPRGPAPPVSYTPGETQSIIRPKTTVGPVIRGEYITADPREFEGQDRMNQMSLMERYMAGNLSPRKQRGPSGMPGQSYTHYSGYGMPTSYVGALDLQAPNFTYATGQQRPINNYSVYGPPPVERRPMPRHNERVRRSDDYVHNAANFYSTAPASRGYYIINPDWVSERSGMRRSKSLLSF